MQKESSSKDYTSGDASYVNDSDDGGDLMVTRGYMGVDEWILHSDSFHITLNRDFFSTYEKLDGGNVTLGNDDTCKVVSIGHVVIKIHEGMVRTLCAVRHVLGLKKNLFSLVTLDALGCKCSCESGIMNITKGLLILMRGVMVGEIVCPTRFHDHLIG